MVHVERYHGGDRYALSGYWGPPTAIANFCEEDYSLVFWAAEFVNSFTNLAYVYFAFKTLNRGESLLSTTAFPNLALFFVGVSSFAFHLTMKYNAQMMDDLSMFWVCAAIIYELYTIGRSSRVKFAFGSTLTAVLGYISARHWTLNQLWLHNWTFILLVTAIWPRVLYLVNTRLAGPERKLAHRQFRVGGFWFIMGFLLWLIDGAYCAPLRAARETIGLPWAFLLELHGWWHILTSIGAGNCILVTKVLTGKVTASASSSKSPSKS